MNILEVQDLIRKGIENRTGEKKENKWHGRVPLFLLLSI